MLPSGSGAVSLLCLKNTRCVTLLRSLESLKKLKCTRAVATGATVAAS